MRQASAIGPLWKRAASQRSFCASTSARATLGCRSDSGSKSTAKGTPATMATMRGSAWPCQAGSSNLRSLRARTASFFTPSSTPPVSATEASGYAHLGTFRRQFQLATATQLATYRQLHRLRSSRHDCGRDLTG